MIDFIEYVIGELQSKRLSKGNALALLEQFSGRSAAANVSRLHPLLHQNTSDLNRQSYVSTFTGDEFFLKDHLVHGQKVLPAVAYLEMARAAMAHALSEQRQKSTLELRNLVWAQPVVVAERKQVAMSLYVNDEQHRDDRIDFEIHGSAQPDGSGDGATPREIVHCQGQALFSDETAPPPHDLRKLRTQMVKGPWHAAEVYSAIARVGIDIGPSHRGVTTIDRGEQQQLVHICLPDVVRATGAEYVLHPSILDSAIQAATSLIVDFSQRANQPPIPFALDCLRIYSACQTEMFSWARYAAGSGPDDKVAKLDIDLCDADGNVCVRMLGFSARILSTQLGAAPHDTHGSQAIGSLFAAPEWEPYKEATGGGAVTATYAERHIILCDLPQVDATQLEAASCLDLNVAEQTLAGRYTDVALACFEKIQALFARKLAGRTLVQVVIVDHSEHDAAESADMTLAGLAGLLKSAAREQPRLIGQLIITNPQITTRELAAQLQEAGNRPHESIIRYDQGEPRVVRWRSIEQSHDTHRESNIAFRDHGVYVITGGTGGLGVLFAGEILRQTADARVILTGRSAPNAETQSVLDRLNVRNEQRVCYRQLDLADLQAVTHFIAAVVEEFGRLNGILHAAGMISDAFILKKTSEQFARVLEPKVAGTFHLDQASRHLDLDFLVLFSAGAAVFGNTGQADYAAANGFMDRFAEYRNRLVGANARRGLTVSINWPLWQEGGMSPDTASREALQRDTGMHPMRTQTGLDAFHRCLELQRHQVLVVEGDLEQIQRALLVEPETQAAPQASVAPNDAAPSAPADTADLAEKTRGYLRKQFAAVLKLPSHKIDPRAPLEKYGIDSILAMELTSQLERTFGSLPKTLFFEYQTIHELADYFIASYASKLAGLFSVAAPAARPDQALPKALPTAPDSSTSSSLQPISGRRFRRQRDHADTMPLAPVAAEPIAIVGLSGRYPEAYDLEEYWRNLRDGKDCIVEIPKDRWDWREYYAEGRSEEGCHYSKWGGFIKGVDEFDPLFFNISPADAELIDPQERLFLQHAWMALEDAGYTRARLQIAHEKDQAGQVGVYVGVMYGEYQLFGAEASLRGKRMGLPVSYASIANRVSYFLNLHGPSMALDTMCSSSLTAIHLACQDLKRGLTSVAIAGGVNVTIHPNKYLLLSSEQFIASGGRCQSFGEGGDGYIPGEGVGVVILKRLSEALRDGDHIHGVIKGSALNHGGKTNGYSVPNPQAQASVISRALREHGVEPRHISYVEAHGTGTKLGDPIEIAALTQVFRNNTPANQFCLIGSAKSNIGHCESAAGIAGLTKVLLQMKHGLIAPSLHSAVLNPHIDFVSTPFLVNQTLRKWQPLEVDGRQLPRLAGISSFGAGGSNAHLVVEEYVADNSAPVHVAFSTPRDDRGQVIITLSARTAEQLTQRALDLLAYTRTQQQAVDLVSMAYTLQIGREAMEERFGLLVSSVEQLTERLQAYVDGEQEIEDAYRGQVKRNQEALSLFSTDADLQTTLDKWLSDRKLAKLLELWVKGLDIDWNKLYAEHRPGFISLPVYPFAKERYWIDAGANGPVPATTAAGMLHPLLHTNTSDFNRQSYRSTFSGKEFFLADHQVVIAERAGQKVLPGVAYLEMARAAIAQALPGQSDSGTLELRDIVWLRPLIVAGHRQVDIALTANSAEQIEFEIYSQDDATEVLHCQGRAILGSRSPAAKLAARLDIKQLEAEMTRATLSPDSVYAAYSQMGLEYGPAHRGITAIELGEQQLLARLSVPAVVEASQMEYLLHPSLLDGALQAAIGLLELATDTVAQARLPFALERLRIISACNNEMIAWVRYAPGGGPHDKLVKLDIDLCDSDGHVCVQMHGLSSRVLDRDHAGATVSERNIGSLLFTPVWQDGEVATSSRASSREYTEHHIILCEIPGVDPRQLEGLVSGSQCLQLQARPQKTLPERYSDHALACFEKLRILLESRPQGQVLVQLVVADTQERAVFAGLAGLLRSASLENAQLVGQVILTPPHTTAQALARQLHDDESSADALIRYQHGVRQVMRWQEMPTSIEPADVTFQDEGVYLITGGLGGLGVLFAREILTHTKSARVVLTGRAALDARRQALLDQLAAPPGRLEYRALDLSNQEQVKQLIAGIMARHSKLDGILHSAGMIADNFILKKSPAEFSRVLAPKVTGTFNLDLATHDTALDFFVLFSSISGAMGNAGQADYAAANGFMDQFAAYRNQLVDRSKRRGRTLSINWPLWLEGGMKMDAASQKLLQQATGLQPLQTANGIQALYRSLQSRHGQMLVVEGDLAQLRSVIVEQTARQIPAAAHAASERPAISAYEEGRTDADRLVEKVQDYLRKQFSTLLKLPPARIDATAALEHYGIDSVLAMKLTGQLEKTFGALSKTLLFEYQTVAALARYLLKAFPEQVRREVGNEIKLAAAAPNTPAIIPTPGGNRQAAASIRSKSRFFNAPAPVRRDVAIVGMGGRYPQAENLQEFWANLQAGRDCITEIPADRWDHALYFDVDRNKAGKSYSRWGGFVADVDKFDPLFFNISPKEAELIDPQERLFLETAWQTVEDAGYSKQSLSGKRVGVFVGVMWGQYELFGAAALAAKTPAVPTSSHASIANRVSYFFDFHGPSIALDTMCSSSLTAIHLACEAIRSGQIEAALAGGVNLSIHPQKYLSLSQGKFASSDGRCRSFGQGGDGYVPGEGVGALFLKPLEDALRDGDQVYAVIKSSSINHGGKTNGYTVPNPNAQGDLILDALRQADIDPRTLGYIETHGTGTSLGDPIEITGLMQAFRGFTEDKQFCPIGSVKSNIGHLEAAAGIAAITKCLLQIRHQQLVPSLHAEPLNPNIHFAESPFYVQTETTAWARQPQHPRRVAVSSFGAGGSNAHLILEEHVDARLAPAQLPPAAPEIFVLSAKDSAALRRYADRVAKFLEQASGESFIDMAYTSQVGRTSMPVRLAIIASSVAELKDKMDLWLASHGGAELEGIFQGNANDPQYNASNLMGGTAGRAFLEDLLKHRDLAKVARLWTLGAEIDWSIAYQEARPRRVTLPTYPFLKERYWVDTAMVAPGSPAAVVDEVVVRAEARDRTYYRPQWKRSPLALSKEPHAGSEPILLLDTEDEFFHALKARLTKSRAEHPIVLARLGRSYREHAPDRFTLDHEREEDFHRLMESLEAQGRFPRLILHRIGRASTLDDQERMREGLSRGVYTLLRACQAWMRQKQQASLRMVSFFSTEDQVAAPLAMALGAFCRTLTLENPRHVCKVMELQPQAGGRAVSVTEEAELVWDEIREPHWSTSEIRYQCSLQPQGSNFTRHIKEYASYQPAQQRAAELPLKQHGAYLITGGLGGLGFIFAAYLAKNFHARLVLVGRSALDTAQAEKLERLQSLGSEVLYVRGDVAKFADAESIIGAAKARFAHINGVIHSAGVTQDSFVLKKTREQMDAVLAPKVYGTVNLDRATSEEPLDLFVMFSSVAAVLGNLGQCDYAYGNHFMDAFAHTREQSRAAGQRSGGTLSINWPFWEEGGMTLSADDVAFAAERIGMQPLPTEEGIKYWEDLLRTSWPQGIALYGSPAKIASYIASAGAPADPGHRIAATVDDPAGLLARTETYLKNVIGAEIKLAPDRIDSLARFESFGIESVVISRCNAQLERDLGALPKTLLYEYETVRELASYLLQEARDALANLFEAATGVAEPQRPAEELQEKHVAAEMPIGNDRDSLEPIAIIGVHGYYPQSNDLNEYWEHLKRGDDLVDLVPAARWDWQELYDHDPRAAELGKIYCKWGSFLSNYDRFDAGFFNIPPEEARVIDPQERLFLESAWAAIEDAGYTRDTLKQRFPKGRGVDAGVFVGVTNNSYHLLAAQERLLGNNASPAALPWSIANRLSYFFDFKGPSLPVDTACSSSLVALHLACESLRNRECQVAVAGGVNLYLHPSKYLSLCQRRMLSLSGRCRSYGAGDDGFVPGEGVGTLVLKRLTQAVADQDHIYALIPASGFDHGGRSNGYSAPNPNAQASLVEATLDKARIHPESVSYVEGHGTGTQLGDNLEVAALTQAFATRTTRQQFCALGSVKTNVGHSESAAGIAGVTKVLLQMKHGYLVPTLHSTAVNPDIEFEKSPFRLQHELSSWEGAAPHPRRALVNSFGAGGVNACVVLEEYRRAGGAPEKSMDGPPCLFTLSAKTEDRLREYAQRLLAFLSNAPNIDLASLCYTLQVGREAMQTRLATVVTDVPDLVRRLEAWLERSSGAEIHNGEASSRRGARRPARNQRQHSASPVIDAQSLSRCAASWVGGEDVDWESLYGEIPPGRLSLPTYPFARERHWISDARATTPPLTVPSSAAQLHPLVAFNASTLREVCFSSWLPDDAFYAVDHRVRDEPIFPGAAFLEIACLSGRLAAERRVRRMSDIVWIRPLSFQGGAQSLRTFLKPIGDGVEFAITSLDEDNERVVHCEGRLLFEAGPALADASIPPEISIGAFKAQCAERREGAQLYAEFDKYGLHYGPTFQTIQEVHVDARRALSKLTIAAALQADFDQFILHPSLVDGALQTVAALVGSAEPGVPCLPFALDEVEILRPLGQSCYAYVEVAAAEASGAGVRQFNIQLLNERGETSIRLKHLHVRAQGKVRAAHSPPVTG